KISPGSHFECFHHPGLPDNQHQQHTHDHEEDSDLRHETSEIVVLESREEGALPLVEAYLSKGIEQDDQKDADQHEELDAAVALVAQAQAVQQPSNPGGR